MKYLFLFFLISTTVFSQNYHYAVDEAKEAATPDATAPTSPINLVVNNITKTTATLNWTASTDDVGVADYRIYNNNTLLVNSVNGNVTSYTLTGLTPATNYVLTIRATDAAANISENSNSQIITTLGELNYASTRFIMIGDSYTYSMYTDHLETQAVNRINTSFPDKVVSVHNEGSPGESIPSTQNRIDNLLTKYDFDSTIDTYCVVMLGVNDANGNSPYSNTSQTYRNNTLTDLNYILDAIEEKGFTPILLESPFANINGTAFNDESTGTKPWNDNIIIPTILSRTPEFAFSDGQSFMQPYTLLYNNFPLYASNDNLHPSDEGYSAMKEAFVKTIVTYIFTGVAPTKIIKTGEPPISIITNNMPGEDDYLNAHYYPVSGSSISGLQNVIDTYGSVRLDPGDYGENRGTIYLRSNNKLYGFVNSTLVPNIVIEQGSSNIIINGVNYSNIEIQSGASVNNNIIKNIRATDINIKNAMFENNIIINQNGALNWDCNDFGYFRNNLLIKHWPHGGSPQIQWKGNNTTPSYGNLQLWVNHLTSAGDTGIYENLQDATIIGIDAEGWNLAGTSSKAMTYMRNIGKVKITDMGGGNGYSPLHTPAFDIQADNLTMLHGTLKSSGGINNVIRDNANSFFIASQNYTKESTGFDFKAHENNKNISYNNSQITSTLSNNATINNLKNLIFDSQLTPISRPNLPPIPNPTGESWASNRSGKTDQTSYIQNLINTNNIAKLPEGIYYISSTLKLGNNQGIIGAGTGKTAIVGLTDDFPLITFSSIGTNRTFHLRSLTLQGGSTGLLIKPDNYTTGTMVTGLVMQDVVFRNQNYGIHLYRFFGFDNNFLENVNFINCNIGFFQDPGPNVVTNTENYIMYVDKTVFYRCQIINTGIGFSMKAGRPNNLNAWINCEFDGNNEAVDMYYNNHPVFINCDFTNHKGKYVVGEQSPSSFYNCNFSNNNTTSVFKFTSLYAEGCNFNDNVPLMSSVGFNPISAYIMNSTVTGNIGHFNNAVLSNTTMSSNPSLNKLLVNVNNNVETVIINESPRPYPQLLVTH